MDGNSDVAKGKIEEAAGSLTGNENLRKEGKKDEMIGKAKRMRGKVKKEAQKAMNKTQDIG
jgi:uncharacterized protein YjbJ (UPF0337 family)